MLVFCTHTYNENGVVVCKPAESLLSDYSIVAHAIGAGAQTDGTLLDLLTALTLPITRLVVCAKFQASYKGQQPWNTETSGSACAESKDVQSKVHGVHSMAAWQALGPSTSHSKDAIQVLVDPYCIVCFVFFFFKQEDHIFFAQQSRLDWPSHLLEMSFPVSFCIFTLLCCYAYAMLIYVNHYSIFVGWYSMLHSVVVLSLTSTYHSISLQQSAWIILLNSQNRCKLSIVITKRGRRYALIG